MSEDPETRYGLPYFLEDKTGRLSGTEFIDMHDRMKLIYRRRRLNAPPDYYVYEIYDTSRGILDAFNEPKVTMTFGRDDSLGTVGFGSGGEMSEHAVRMEEYLAVVNEVAGSRMRKFFASDGNEYRWGWRLADNEWTCTNKDGEIVAHYNLKHPGEPPYYTSSGCMLTVLEDFGDLAVEMLTTVMIMRHIVEHGL